MAKKKRLRGMNLAMGTVGTVVGGSVALGIGSNVLGSMGQGGIATSTITPAANMLGTVGTAGMGMGVLDMISDMTRKKKKR